MRRIGFALVLAIAPACSALSDSVTRVGNFEVRVQKDRFGTHDTAIASVIAGSSMLAVRCLNGELSLAFVDSVFGQGRWEEGMPASVKVKIDDGPVADVSAVGINDKMIEIGNVGFLIRDMVIAREVALRVTARDIVQDRVFTFKQPTKAIRPVLASCQRVPKAVDAGGEQQAPSKELPAAPATKEEPMPGDGKKLAALLGGPPASTASPPPSPATATIDAAILAQASQVGAIFGAGLMCHMAVRTDRVGDSVFSALPPGQNMNGREFVLATGRVQEMASELAKGWTSRSAEDQKSFCDQARALYGEGGSRIPGALVEP